MDDYDYTRPVIDQLVTERNVRDTQDQIQNLREVVRLLLNHLDLELRVDYMSRKKFIKSK